MINVGFIGLGGMGMYQVSSFVKAGRCRVVAGSDLVPEARARFAKQYPGATVFADHRQLLKDADVQAVVIATPTFYHKQTAIDALRSGRAVMTEKPLARTVADARQVNAVAKQTGQLLMVGQCRRYDTDWGCIAKIVQKGSIGGPVLWRHAMASAGPPSPWFLDDKLGGEPILDGAVHDQDFGVLLFGDPVSVVASSIKLTNTTCVDSVTAVIRYTSGSQMMLCWSWGVAQGEHMFDLIGTEGSIRAGVGDLAEASLDTKKYGYYRLTNTRSGKTKLVRFIRKDMYVTQARHFIACIEGKAVCQSPGTEAIKAVASAEAILKAGPKGAARKIVW